MKNRIYFLISAAVQMVASVFVIMNADKLAKALLEVTDIYPEAMQERMEALFSNGGHTYIIFLAVLSILLNGIIIYLVMNDKLLKKRGTVVTCSAIAFFASLYQIGQLLAILNIIIIMATKRVRPEDFPDEKKKLPVLAKEKVDNEKVVKAVILLAIYFSQLLWKDLIPDEGIITVIIVIGFYVLMIALSIIFFKELLKKNFKEFKKNFKAYLQNLLPLVGKYYLVYYVIAMVSALLVREGALVNQKSVEALPILVSLPLALIYAPIVEETLFRGCLRRFIKNDKVFIIISGLAFGLIHTLSEASMYNVIIVALPYVTMGCFLAYLYVKTNNICTNMAFHAFHNTLAIFISIIIKGLFLI